MSEIHAQLDLALAGMVERVVRVLEDREGVTALQVPITEALRQRIRVLRGKIHNCAPSDWGWSDVPRYPFNRGNWFSRDYWAPRPRWVSDR